MVLPPPKSSRKSEPDSDLQDLISQIPKNMKLTRAQFEELLQVHKARREASPVKERTPSPG